MRPHSLTRAILAIAALLVLPEAVSAYCFCPGGWRLTENQWGFGATCSAAESDAYSKGLAAAEDACAARGSSVCALGSFVPTWPCEPSQMPGHIGEMQRDGQTQYQCLKCIVE